MRKADSLMGESYDTQHPIPRRRSATPHAVALRQTPSRNALSSTHARRHTDDDPSRSPMKPLVRRLDQAPLTATSPPPTRHYRIPLADGTQMHVTERQLADVPATYQNAAHLITSQGAVPRLRRPPSPNHPVQDETVDANPPTRGTTARSRQNRRRFPRFHWLLWAGLVLFSMMSGWIALTALGNWWQTTQDDWHYGRPRTFHLDANVGHGTASHPDSHFIAVNLHQKIIVIEFPGDDPTHAKMYIGPTLLGPGEDVTPVTLSVKDVNGDGRPDLVLHVGGSTFVFLNQRDRTFQPAPTQ